jgi:hypothetical protein
MSEKRSRNSSLLSPEHGTLKKKLVLTPFETFETFEQFATVRNVDHSTGLCLGSDLMKITDLFCCVCLFLKLSLRQWSILRRLNRSYYMRSSEWGRAMRFKPNSQNEVSLRLSLSKSLYFRAAFLNLSFCSLSQLSLNMLRDRGNHITCLNLTSSISKTPDVFHFLPTQLKCLQIDLLTCYPFDFSHLTSLQNLECLSLGRRAFPETLLTLTNLRALRCGLSKNAVLNLEKLQILDIPLETPSKFYAFYKGKSLRKVRLVSAPVSQESFVMQPTCLDHFRGIESLDIDIVSDRVDLKRIGAVHSLRELRISAPNALLSDLRSLRGLVHLQELDIAFAVLGSLCGLETLTLLEHLRIDLDQESTIRDLAIFCPHLRFFDWRSASRPRQLPGFPLTLQKARIYTYGEWICENGQIEYLPHRKYPRRDCFFCHHFCQQ